MAREVMRKMEEQKKLDKQGFVVLDMLSSNNYAWLDDVLLKFQFNEIGNSVQLQNALNDKLQSKVEYRFINCSPLFYRFKMFNDRPSKKYQINNPILDETKESAYAVIVPLFKNEEDQMIMSFISKAHELPLYPRPINTELDLVSYQKTKLRFGQVVVFHNSLPYKIVSEDTTTYMEIAVAPYEARLKILSEDESRDNFVVSYKITPEKYINYALGVLDFDHDLRKLESHEVSQPDIPSDYLEKKSFFDNFIDALKCKR